MTINSAINHWPVFKGIRLCGEKQGTANAHQTITCKCCREMLDAKIAAHAREAAKAKGSEARFHAGTAAHWQSVLDRVA